MQITTQGSQPKLLHLQMLSPLTRSPPHLQNISEASGFCCDDKFSQCIPRSEPKCRLKSCSDFLISLHQVHLFFVPVCNRVMVVSSRHVVLVPSLWALRTALHTVLSFSHCPCFNSVFQERVEHSPPCENT